MENEAKFASQRYMIEEIDCFERIVAIKKLK